MQQHGQGTTVQQGTGAVLLLLLLLLHSLLLMVLLLLLLLHLLPVGILQTPVTQASTPPF